MWPGTHGRVSTTKTESGTSCFFLSGSSIFIENEHPAEARARFLRVAWQEPQSHAPKTPFYRENQRFLVPLQISGSRAPTTAPSPPGEPRDHIVENRLPRAPKSFSENHIFYKENRKFHVLPPHDMCSCYAKMCTAPQRELHFEIRGKKVQNRMLPKPYFLQGKSKILLYEQTFANIAIASLCGQAHTDAEQQQQQQQHHLAGHVFTSAGARFSLKMSTPPRRDARAEPDPHQQ